MRYILIILILLISCSKTQNFECVCYPNKTPEKYTKYIIQNSYYESQKYCDSLSNINQKCYLTN